MVIRSNRRRSGCAAKQMLIASLHIDLMNKLELISAAAVEESLNNNKLNKLTHHRSTF